MKQFLFYSLLFLVACGDNSSAVGSQATDNSTTETSPAPATTASAEADDIVGEWEMIGSVLDTNDNLLVDEDERKNLKASYKDYMKLNSDGSGLFTVARMEGRYEAAARESGGKKFLTWYDKGDGKHRIGTIVSVSKDELHIKEPGGNGLFVWKRL